ncbi:hypothetical protein P43SY_008660 [Pythium insidiosum]|uniref:Phosphodiesterase n=1 Tax=Pythium insidiosum TaxID=114742 RepID=A0AAD5LK93_PYTIN|nr:hypothetical protein P43SY_008660 [Pythium insidiosum]
MGKRSVQVSPNRLTGSEKPIVIRQEVHWISCHFLNSNVESAFQLYYRRTKQTSLTTYMLLMIALNVAMTAGTTLNTLGEMSSHFARLVEPSTSSRGPMERIDWISDTIVAILLGVFSAVALLCITATVKARLNELVWTPFGLDPVQSLLVIFNQLITVPILLSSIACIELELSYLRDFKAASQSTNNRQILVLLGLPHMDTLYFVLFVTLSLSSCVLRLQFSYFLVIAIEFAIFITALSVRYFPNISDHWSWFAVFLVLLVMVAKGVWDSELSCRLEFLASCKLLNENRRLSNQNIVMQEELSGKLNYQLHYEMGDILRLLCQIKMKMSASEKKDIDKIITALITNEDLFEVSLDPATAEHEEELNIDDTTFFVGLVAAAAHDISHPGVSNGFLISTRSKLAITYSDDSVLERMHIAELYRILSHEKFDIFSHFDVTVRSDIRRLLIQMILATDLSRHFQHITKLKSRKFAVTDDTRGVDLSLVMETLLMLSDLGHTAKPFAYHQIWANRIAEEFFRQGEAEERHNLPVSPLCDRRQANLPKSQVTFLTLLATPLFETAGEAFTIDEYDLVMTHLQGNIRTWQSMIPRNDSTEAAISSRSGRPALLQDVVSSDLNNASSSSERRRREASRPRD